MGSAVDKRRKIYSLDSAAVSKGIAVGFLKMAPHSHAPATSPEG